ncbi:C6 zinc finger domain [Lecanosticta acicola]|uniref:C6 zinc finger domain n=1 Tax=Lecanosticta acicola TaxID=111012 RepID=A0AAI8YV45_9PEZI|nr:C6 zinc finger domain [Lecanosticta acicola]
MPERKSHVKSRLGCGQCKTRRVKVSANRSEAETPQQQKTDGKEQCDETRPTCGNCKRRRETCTYTNRNTKSTNLSSPASNGSDHTNAISSSVHLKQLELMHHWSTSTYASLALSNGARRASRYQLDVPRLALENEYLLETMYALTSLHLAYQRPNDARSLIQDATGYNTRALAACREALAALEGPNAGALFYCSALLGVVALALRAVDPDTAAAQTPTDTLAQLTIMWRGTWSVIIASKEILGPEEYNTLFHPPAWNMLQGSSVRHQSQIFLDRLRERAKAEDHTMMQQDQNSDDSPTKQETGVDVTKVYLETLDLTQVLLSTPDLEHSRIIAWPVLCPVPFMDFVTQKRPLAMAIVLLYSVLLRSMDELWWLGSLRADLVNELAPLVAACGPEMAEIVDWVQSWTSRPDELGPIHTSNWADDRTRRISPIKMDDPSPILHTPSWAEARTSRHSPATDV